MLWPYFCTLVPDSLVFAGHALTLFLLSPRKYQFRNSCLIWVGVFLLSLLFPLICIPFGLVAPSVVRHMVSLGLCAVAFLLTSDGPHLQNLFLLPHTSITSYSPLLWHRRLRHAL